MEQDTSIVEIVGSRAKPVSMSVLAPAVRLIETVWVFGPIGPLVVEVVLVPEQVNGMLALMVILPAFLIVTMICPFEAG